MQEKIEASAPTSQPSEAFAESWRNSQRGARAEVMVLKDDRAVLMAENMPPVPEDKTFQIWVIEGDVPKPSGLFEAEQEPVAVVEKPLDKAPAP